MSHWIAVDPQRIRFQHSRIRPYFSGCGRSLIETLQSIRDGEMAPSDLPPIQVLVGPVDADGEPWYFALNNRRLWVLKRCREEGLLLPSHQILVRVRAPKSQAERDRYTLARCVVEAKLVREGASGSSTKDTAAHSTSAIIDRSSADTIGANDGNEAFGASNQQMDRSTNPHGENDENEDDDSSDCSSDSSPVQIGNPFSLLS